jgi:hypothetical protein
MGKTLPHKLLKTSSPGIAEKLTKDYRQSLLTVCQTKKAIYVQGGPKVTGPFKIRITFYN